MKIKITISVIVLLLLVGGIVVWQMGSSILPKTNTAEEITFGYNLWPGVLPYLVAYDKGFFADQGLKAKPVLINEYTELISELDNGKIDFSGDIVLMDVIAKRSEEKDWRVVGITDYSAGADGIIVPKEFQNLTDLKGKKIAVEEKSLGEYLLRYALEKHNLLLSDVITVNYSSVEAVNAFIRGEVDAAVSYEPDLSRGVEIGQGKLIFTSAEAPGLITDVLVFKQTFLDAYPERVSGVLRAYFSGVEFIEKNPTEAYEIGSKYFSLSAEDFAKQVSGLKILNQRDNTLAFSYAAGLESIYGNAKEINRFMIDSGFVESEIRPETFIIPDFIRQINKEKVK